MDKTTKHFLIFLLLVIHGFILILFISNASSEHGVICDHRHPKTHQNIKLPFFMRDYDQQEEEANYLGSTLQITRDGLIWALRKRMEIDEIAEHYYASPSMVKLRVNSTGVKGQLSYFFK